MLCINSYHAGGTPVKFCKDEHATSVLLPFKGTCVALITVPGTVPVNGNEADSRLSAHFDLKNYKEETDYIVEIPRVRFLADRDQDIRIDITSMGVFINSDVPLGKDPKDCFGGSKPTVLRANRKFILTILDTAPTGGEPDSILYQDSIVDIYQ